MLAFAAEPPSLGTRLTPMPRRFSINIGEWMSPIPFITWSTTEAGWHLANNHIQFKELLSALNTATGTQEALSEWQFSVLVLLLSLSLHLFNLALSSCVTLPTYKLFWVRILRNWSLSYSFLHSTIISWAFYYILSTVLVFKCGEIKRKVERRKLKSRIYVRGLIHNICSVYQYPSFLKSRNFPRKVFYFQRTIKMIFFNFQNKENHKLSTHIWKAYNCVENCYSTLHFPLIWLAAQGINMSMAVSIYPVRYRDFGTSGALDFPPRQYLLCCYLHPKRTSQHFLHVNNKNHFRIPCTQTQLTSFLINLARILEYHTQKGP